MSSQAKIGIWCLGAKGGVASTVIVGALAIAKGLSGTTGLLTENSKLLSNPAVEFAGFGQMVFGGYDIRDSSLLDSVEELAFDLRVIPGRWVKELEADLNQINQQILPGYLYSSGPAIEKLASPGHSVAATSASDMVAAVRKDLLDFKTKHQLDELVVINLCSTEAPPAKHEAHQSEHLLDQLIQSNDTTDHYLRASSLYAWAAADVGACYLNFTPSPAAILPAIVEKFTRLNLPLTGSDGKTGETLVKATLASLFKNRSMKVLSWQGYNMLGDRDGEVLATEENKKSKIDSKDDFLSHYFGYPLHTQVSIDFVPSLHDHKTAWDFIHFEGFLGHKMNMQFTWQGCDSILAAPLVLDLARLLHLAKTKGQGGAQPHLAAFFKSPLAAQQEDFPTQMEKLLSYLGSC